MNYFIAFIDSENEFDWCVMESKDYDFMLKVFENLCPPPGWDMELRKTEEDIETYKTYEVIRKDDEI